MNVAILCGGKGTRLAELTEGIPKGLIPVGNKPIVWHIMRYFASFGHKDFVLLVGYMAEKFRRYFEDHPEPEWALHFSDSGQAASKSRRLADARSVLQSDRFFLAYGDDLSDVDLDAVLAQNDASGALATLTAVRPVSAFGTITMAEDGTITRFEEKRPVKEWINGGYMAIRPGLLDQLHLGELEEAVLPALAARGAIDALRHDGFWMSMNTFKESQRLNAMWRNGDVPWAPREDR